MNSEFCVLIMAGGKGTRFWPKSTEEKPKQFISLIEDRTMLQVTIDRIRRIIFIVLYFLLQNLAIIRSGFQNFIHIIKYQRNIEFKKGSVCYMRAGYKFFEQ